MQRSKKKKILAIKPRNPKGIGGFKPGNTYGPGAARQLRPDFLTQALISQLNELEKKGDVYKNRPKFARIVDKMIAMAITGNGFIIKEIFDRVQGRAKQAIELGGPDGDHIRVETITRTIIHPGDIKREKPPEDDDDV